MACTTYNWGALSCTKPRRASTVHVSETQFLENPASVSDVHARLGSEAEHSIAISNYASRLFQG